MAPTYAVTADVAALYVQNTLGRPSSPGAIRVLAHRNPDRIRDYGRVGRRRVYNLAEIHEVITGESLNGA